jgi:16S rRNA U516 pseudouridylate synthase RsuA-like enzyme
MRGERDARVSLSRALSKLGVCSRAQAAELVGAGRVRLNGVVRRELATRVDLAREAWWSPRRASTSRSTSRAGS